MEEEGEIAAIGGEAAVEAEPAAETPPSEEPAGCQLHAGAFRSSKNLGWLFFLPFVGVFVMRKRMNH